MMIGVEDLRTEGLIDANEDFKWEYGWATE